MKYHKTLTYLKQLQPLSIPLSSLKGIGPKRAVHLAQKGVHTVLDLLFFTPLRYEDRTAVTLIKDVPEKDITAPIHIHPENPKLFEFKGKPVVLLCATEHYGAVMNRPFDFDKYLADAADKKQTLTRLFLLFRELQNAMNPYSTCKPESPDYISPFVRTGPENALDGLPKYDLDEYNPEFFNRLHRFLSLASEYGIVVEVVLFSNTYAPQIWSLNPLNRSNNINDVVVIDDESGNR